jgi:hypothetical protein
MRHKGRRVRSFQAGERRQYQPGELAQNLDPALRQQLEDLAVAGYAAQGRGLLIVTRNATTETGIVSAEYLQLHELVDIGGAVPFAEARPVMTVVHQYAPESEFVVLALEVTPTLSSPQLWLDVVPRTRPAGLSERVAARKQESSADHRAALLSAYVAIEALAREGYATQGRRVGGMSILGSIAAHSIRTQC